MRLPTDHIKQALLHPDRFVRDVALHYFADSFSLDPTVMPLVIGAIERFGWDAAFEYFYIAQNLVQTDETILWLVSQLEGTRLTQDNAARVGSIIHLADAGLLARHQARLNECKWLDGGHRKIIREKISLLSVTADACWKELEDLCERYRADKHGDQLPMGRATRLVESIARDGDKCTDRVLPVLSHQVEDFENDPWLWLEMYAAMLAGLARLYAAAPLLVAKLKSDDGDYPISFTRHCE